MSNNHRGNDNGEESAFYGEKVESKDYLQDGTYYTDEVQKVRNRRKLGVAAILAVAILFIVGLALALKFVVFNNPEHIQEPDDTQTTEPVDNSDHPTPDYTEPEKPLTQLIPETTVSSGKTTAFVDGNSIQTTDGTNIILADTEIKATIYDCETNKPTDFCDLAQITLGKDKDAKIYQSYFLKDAVNSRFFENPTNFQKTEITNVPGAAIMNITTLDGSETPVLVLLQENGSGFMFVPNSNNTEDLTTLVNTINEQ